MYTSHQKRFQNWIVFFISIFVALCVGLFLFCFDENPTGGDNLPTEVEIKVAPPSDTARDIHSFFVGENISVCIQVLEVEPIDSIVFGIIKNPELGSTEESIKAAVDTVLHRGDIVSKNKLTIHLNQPGTFLLGAYARSKDTIDIDTMYVSVVEENGKNKPPVVHVNLFRPYAAPSLPCSLRVSFSNQESWQIVKLLIDSMDQNITRVGDSLCIWVPSGSDISKTHPLRIVASDNGKPPITGDTTVTVVVISDNQQPLAPQDLRIAERSTDMVKLVWKMDSLVDGYTVLRSRTGAITIWDTVGETKLPEFVDSTDTIFMYRVVANNYFGKAASGTDIVARDTVHYAHAIGFEKAQSPASENDSVLVIRLKASQAAKVPISVCVSAKENNADTGDYKLQTTKAEFQKGDTIAEVRLRIINDDKEEPPESLTVVIDSVASGYLSGILQHKVVIADNDTLYKVTYEKNGADSGTIPIDSCRYKRGAKVTVKGNTGTLKKYGYTFEGWNTSADGKGIKWQVDTVITIGNENISLFAQWRAITTVADVTLSSLKISAGSLEPKTAPILDTLRDTVSFIDSAITVTPAVVDTMNSIIVNTVFVKSGTASPPVVLSVGINEVNITVIASIGTATKTYVLFVVRRADSSVKLTEPPTGIIAQGNSTSAICISWKNMQDVTYYTIQGSSELSGVFSNKGTTTTNSYIDTGLESGSTWYYRISASNSKGATDFSVPVGAVTFLKPTITRQPDTSILTTEGGRAFISVAANGIPTPVFQWQKNEVDIPNAISASCTTSVLALTDNGNRYRCIISNSAGTITSEVARLTVDSLFTKPNILSQPHDTTIISGSDIKMEVIDTGSYCKVQWRKDGIDLPQATTRALILHSVKTSDAGSYTVKIWNRSDSANTIPFRLRIRPKMTTGLSGKALSAFSIGLFWEPADGALWYRVLRISGTTNNFASICSTSQTSMIDSSLTEGVSYTYRLLGCNNDAESDSSQMVTTSTWKGPQIDQQPLPQTLLEQQTIFLSVTASGVPACTYQWQKNGNNISGADKSFFILDNAAVTDSGNYKVVVTNGVRSKNSNPVRVNVIPTYTLNTTMLPAEGGFVSRSKDSSFYPSGTIVELVAHANTGFRFTGWSGDTSGTDSVISINILKNRSVFANFIPQYSVNLSISLGKGNTTPTGINLYDSGTSVIIGSTPQTGYRFSRWKGDLSTTKSDTQIIIDHNLSISAEFIKQFKLTLSVESGKGSVVPSSDMIIDSGKAITLSAIPDTGWRMILWKALSGNPLIENPVSSVTTIILTNNDAKIGAFFVNSVCTWGENENGQIGNGTSGNDQPTVQQVVVGPSNTDFLGDIKAVTGGYGHTLYLKNDSTVWACGYNSKGQLGDGTLVSKTKPVQVHGQNNVGYLSGIIEISAGRYHSVALASNGTVWAWGQNDSGQLGNGDSLSKLDCKTPICVLGQGGMGYLSSIKSIATGLYHTLALSNTGIVWAWGMNGLGQLGSGTVSTFRSLPDSVRGLNCIPLQIAGGGYHSIVLSTEGKVRAWGWNESGQLGNNDSITTSSPVSVTGLGGAGELVGVKKIAELKGNFTIVLMNDGSLMSWGYNGSGQLGIGSREKKIYPVQISGMSNIIAIATGYSHTLALRNDNTIWSWGMNTSGQLGIGSIDSRHESPMQVAGKNGIGFISGISIIGAGYNHSIAGY